MTLRDGKDRDGPRVAPRDDVPPTGAGCARRAGRRRSCSPSPTG
ncbi:hypothetical protein [Actinomadura madurae]|nr:hypothetical protein [Actinomadura madurae]MCP9964302.1 hypothetical protein [Actinomadura madurae]MCP9976788.1 hypothetical protein [Actinomadura madurae]